jgi:ribosomal protein S18 acetylase RimI-like enzyme
MRQPLSTIAAVAIRAMVLEDYDAIRSLWEASEGVGLSEGDSREGVAAYLERNPNLSLLAYDQALGAGKNIVGAVLCGQDGRRGDLVHLAVALAYRRQGIGRRLVEECLARLRAIGIMKCNIRVYRENSAGQAFWERLGFAVRADLAIMQCKTGLDA